MATVEEREILRQSLEARKRALQLAVEELAEATTEWTPVRELFRQRPFACLAGAMMLGLWLGSRG